jgi:simple sugar transport system substrate-binding protein
MIKFGPTTELSATLDNWAPYYIKRIGDVLAGTWKSTDTWGGFDSGMLEMAPFRNMPTEVAALAANTIADITSHKNQIFVGPLSDQAGTVKLPAGVVMDDATISSLQWLVQGVDGTLS